MSKPWFKNPRQLADLIRGDRTDLGAAQLNDESVKGPVTRYKDQEDRDERQAFADVKDQVANAIAATGEGPYVRQDPRKFAESIVNPEPLTGDEYYDTPREIADRITGQPRQRR